MIIPGYYLLFHHINMHVCCGIHNLCCGIAESFSGELEKIILEVFSNLPS